MTDTRTVQLSLPQPTHVVWDSSSTPVYKAFPLMPSGPLPSDALPVPPLDLFVGVSE